MSIQSVWSKTPSYAKWVVVALLALGLAFTAGRYSAPTKTVEVTVVDKTTEEKLRKVESELATSRSEYALLQQEKQKVVVETKYVSQKVTAADKNTKCVEDFDRKTGKLVRRACERTEHNTSTESETKLANVTAERDSLKQEVSTLTTEQQRLLTVEQSFAEHMKTTHTKTVENSLPDWQASAYGLLEPSLSLELKDVEFGVSIERRIFGSVYLGVVGIPQSNLYGLKLTIGF